MIEFKRMDEVEGVIVSYDFEFAWDRISASSMNEETTCVTHRAFLYLLCHKDRK